MNIDIQEILKRLESISINLSYLGDINSNLKEINESLKLLMLKDMGLRDCIEFETPRMKELLDIYNKKLKG